MLFVVSMFGLPLIAYATVSEGCKNNENNFVTMPCQKSGWGFGMNAIYVQTNNIGVTTGTLTEKLDTSSFTYNTDLNTPAANWQWGLQMSLSYYFGTGNDISVDWTHFVHTSSEFLNSNPVLDFDAEYLNFPIGFFLFKGGLLTTFNPIDSISTDIGNNFDAVNLELGQLIYLGKHVDTRVFAGLQYASIQQTVTQTGWNSSDSSVYDQTNMKSQFSGVGPRLGINNTYHLNEGWSIFGNVAGSLLLGDLSFNSAEIWTANAESMIDGRVSSNSMDNNNVLTPEMDGKIGVRYQQPFVQGDLTLEVGYTVAEYWGAAAINDLGAYNGGYSHEKVINFAYDGVTLGLKWLGSL